MIRELLRSRAFVAGVGALTVVGVMGASVVAVQALAQEQEQEQAQEEATSIKESQYRLQIEHAMAAAKRAMAASELGMQRALMGVKEAEHARLQEIQERLHMIQEKMPWRIRLRGMPHIDIRGRGTRGLSAQRVLAQAEELGLTDDQVAQIKDARRSSRRAEIERDAAIEVAELDLDDLLEDYLTADLGAVEAKLQEIASLRVQNRIADMRLMQQVNAVLTPEQREKVEEGLHNVFIMRRGGDGPHGFLFDGGRMFNFDSDIFEPLEWIQEFEFGGEPGLFEWKSKEEADQKKKEEAKKKKGQEGVSVESSPAVGGIGVKAL